MRRARLAIAEGERMKKRRKVQHEAERDSFRQWLLTKYAQGAISARDTCVVAWTTGKCSDKLGVTDIALDPSTLGGGRYQRHLDGQLGLDQFAEEELFWATIPLHDPVRRRRVLGRHPFLLPHRQVDESWEDSVCDNKDILSLPINQDTLKELDVVREQGPLRVALCRAYTDGVDCGGKSRKQEKKVFVFSWTPLGQSKELRGGASSR